MTDRFAVQWEPTRGPQQKMVFEPHSEGGYLRTTYEWTGCRWRETGSERVVDVTLEQSPSDGGITKYRGP